MDKVVATVLVIGVTATILAASPEAHALTLADGWLCVDRTEDMGFANIVPVTVEADALYEITVGGGDHRCTPVVPGRYKIRLSWSWAPRNPHPRHVKTVPISRVIKPGETSILHVCMSPKAKKSYPRWQLGSPDRCAR